jgi:hypothetical protein
MENLGILRAYGSILGRRSAFPVNRERNEGEHQRGNDPRWD